MRQHRRTLTAAVACSAIAAAVAAAFAVVPVAGLADARTQAERFDAALWVEAWVKLWRTYDLSLIDDLFLQDDRVTYFSSEREGLIVGIDAIREHHEGFGFVEGGRAAESELWVDDLHVSELGDSVVVGATWYFGDREDRDAAQRGPMTAVWVAAGDGYRIAHMHFAGYE